MSLSRLIRPVMANVQGLLSLLKAGKLLSLFRAGKGLLKAEKATPQDVSVSSGATAITF